MNGWMDELYRWIPQPPKSSWIRTTGLGVVSSICAVPSFKKEVLGFAEMGSWRFCLPAALQFVSLSFLFFNYKQVLFDREGNTYDNKNIAKRKEGILFNGWKFPSKIDPLFVKNINAFCGHFAQLPQCTQPFVAILDMPQLFYYF